MSKSTYGAVRPAFLLDRGTDSRFPVFANADGQLLAEPRTGTGAPVAILSIPKAGTYLLARFMKTIGLIDCGLHVSSHFLTDCRGLSEANKLNPPTYHLGLRAWATLMGDGQFVVGHLACDHHSVAVLSTFRRIFIHRDLIDATISHLRFLIATRRGRADADWMTMQAGPDQLLAFLGEHGMELFAGSYQPLLGWLDVPGTFVMDYETLAGDVGLVARDRMLNDLAAFLSLTRQDLVQLFDESVFGKPTPTLSSGRTARSAYWREDVAEAFRALGVNAIQERLGHPPI